MDLQTKAFHLSVLKCLLSAALSVAPRAQTADSAKAASPDTNLLTQSRQFWSFQPVKDFDPPAVRNQAWPRTPVDRFVLAKLEENGLHPNPDADKVTLIRRATFNLTGLPPAAEDVKAFLADGSAEAFERVVDRLLASRQYGEHWGRHWLDVARYADTSGCNSDFPIPTAYLYRNYVIESFNQDKPYDQFVREQIAGDLLPSQSEKERYEKIIATGYLALGRRFGSRASEFHLTIEDNIDNLGKAFLGLSTGCARCHDHKYDPVTAEDYYALYGIFSSTRYAFPGTEIYRHAKDYVPLANGEEAEQYYKDAAELAELDDKIEKLLEKKRSFERMLKVNVEAEEGASQVKRKDTVKVPEYQNLIEVKAALEDARTRQQQLERKTYKFEKAYAVREGKPGNAKLQKKGDPKTLGEEIPRRFLQILGGQPLPADCQSSGRYELAQWIADAKNPLTTRVMVNRVWQHHFGKGIVQTPNDFGARGKPPTHPELLDYLATHFVASGWSIKSLHKLLMLSRSYQMTSDDDPGKASIDPNNDSLWKFNRRRLSAEETRDAMLAISGGLDRSMGGPHPFPPESEWRYTQHRPFVAVYETNRRSVYLMQQRIKKHPFLEMFDGADPNATTAERSLSTTPLQALFMMNDPFAHEQADKLAVRVGMAFMDESRRIDYAYRLAFARPATEEEIQISRAYLANCLETLEETDMAADQRPRAALASLMRVLLSSNEFLYID